RRSERSSNSNFVTNRRSLGGNPVYSGPTGVPSPRFRRISTPLQRPAHGRSRVRDRTGRLQRADAEANGTTPTRNGSFIPSGVNPVSVEERLTDGIQRRRTTATRLPGHAAPA